MMKEQRPGILGNLTVWAALLLILVLSVLNISSIGDVFMRFFRQEISFSGLTEEVSSVYTSDQFVLKDTAITLNGLFANLTGRRVYNSTVKMNNGMLTALNASPRTPVAAAKRVSGLSAFLRQRNIPLLSVVCPYKVPLSGDLMPAGQPDGSNEERDLFVSMMQDGEVNILDLRNFYSADQDQIEQFFYRTDHHWTPDASLDAFARIMQELEDMLSLPLDRRYTDPALWERHELKDWWIGSNGKRVGPLFAGTDSLIWFSPKFDTCQSYAYARTNNEFGFRKGDFSSICLFPDEFAAVRDFYGLNAQAIYMKYLYPLVVHRNLHAPNAQKIMLIGDSFCRAMQTFLSTEFAEVHMLDTRYYTASSIAQYAAWNHPDAVIIMSQTVAGTFYIKFGEDQQASWETDYPDEMVLLSDHSMTSYLLAGDLSSRIVPVSLESGQVYHLSFDHVSVSDENTACLSAVLFEKTQNRTVWAQVFDVDYGNAYHSFEWSFSVPAENAENRQYVLLLSPGVWKNSEANLSAVISGITLRKEI